MRAEPLSPPQFACVVAADEGRGIGKDNRLPWPPLRGDLAHLKAITTCTERPGARNAVIMGRHSWESIPPRFQPLPDRLNLVVSRRALVLPPGVAAVGGLDAALAEALQAKVERVFVLGGAQLYATAFQDPRCRFVYITRIAARYDCDTFLPGFEDGFSLSDAEAPHTEQGVTYWIERWTRR